MADKARTSHQISIWSTSTGSVRMPCQVWVLTSLTSQSSELDGALKPLSEAMLRFNQELGVPRESDYHTTRSSDKVLDRVLKQILDESNVFSNIPGRAHTNFKQFAPNSMSQKGLEQWVTTNANKILACR